MNLLSPPALLIAALMLMSLAAAPAAHALGADPDRAAALIAEGAVVIDVRSAEEIQATGMVAGARQVARRDTEALREAIGPELDQPVVLYCTNGLRSSFAIDDLRNAGYTHLVNGGGYDELQRALAARN